MDFNMDVNKRLITKIGGVFVAILLFLTFFSSTIYSFNLPGVVVGYTRQGVLTKSAEGRGIVEFARMEPYYADRAGKVTLLVSEGERVATGSELFTITSELEDLREALDGRQRSEERLNMRLESARSDLQHARNSLAGLRNEAEAHEFDATEFDYEIQRVETQIGAMERDLSDLKALFELGAVPQREIDEKEAAIDGLNLQLTQQHERKQRALENYNKAVEAGARELASRRAGLEKSVADYSFQVYDCEFEIASNSLEMDRLRAQIEAGGIMAITSDSYGRVREIRAGIETGAFVNKNELIMRVGTTVDGFKTVVELPESVDFLSAGDPVSFNISSRDIYGLEGVVESLMFYNGRLKAVIGFASGKVGGGETAEVKIQKTSQLYDMLIPNRALRFDDNGAYVLYVEMVSGFFGDEYYARRARVMVNERDNYNTAIFMLLGEEKPAIILNSDKAVYEGDRVRVVDN